MSNKQEYRDALAKEFLEALKQPEIEYYCPWYSFASQRNGVTNRKYNGLNSLYLNLVAYKNNWEDSRWFTFTQLKKLNESRKPEEAYSVKGQHGMPVEFFTVYDVQEKQKISLRDYYRILREASDDQLENIQKRYRVHNEYTTVFNAHQIQNMELMKKEQIKTKDIDSKNIEDLAKSINVKLNHESIDKAFYNKKEDAIHLPFAGYFKSQNDYNYTALHELSHSTGHESRLARDLTGIFGTEQYALEELIAEMSCSFYGFNLDKNSDPKILDNHKAYIQSWAKVIENDQKKFFDAVSQAQKAADYLEEHSEFLKEKELAEKYSLEDMQKTTKDAEAKGYKLLSFSYVDGTSLLEKEGIFLKQNFEGKEILFSKEELQDLRKRAWHRTSEAGSTEKDVSKALYYDRLIEDYDKKFTILKEYPDIEYCLARSNTPDINNNFQYVAGWKLREDGKWEQGHYFDTIDKALNFIQEKSISRVGKIVTKNGKTIVEFEHHDLTKQQASSKEIENAIRETGKKPLNLNALKQEAEEYNKNRVASLGSKEGLYEER